MLAKMQQIQFFSYISAQNWKIHDFPYKPAEVLKSVIQWDEKKKQQHFFLFEPTAETT